MMIVVLFKQAGHYAWGKVTPQSSAGVVIGIPSDHFSYSLQKGGYFF